MPIDSLPPNSDDDDVDNALVDSLAIFDERLRRGETSLASAETDGELTETNTPDPDPAGTKAVLVLLERAFPRAVVEPVALDNQRIGRFELLRVLGQGGFGIVYLAHDPVLKRQVALKVPRLHTLGSAILHERFLREARAVAALDHPQIAPILETGQAGPVCYLASLYCDGGDLEQWLGEHAPVAPRTASQLVQLLADATHYSHSRGILHRDLKPSNILLSADNAKIRDAGVDDLPFNPRITDFGLARVAEDDTGNTGSALLGTPRYMAPEQAAGRKDDVCAATDVYALGTILYELLTGRPPFLGSGVIEVLNQIRMSDPVPPSRLVRSVPRDLETICLKCLRKEPNQRYTTAAKLRDDLRAWLAGRPIVARQAGLLERGAKWVRRRPLAASLMFVVAGAAASLIGLQWRHSQTLADNLKTTEALRADAVSREASSRLQVNVSEINAAELDLFHNSFQAAAQRVDLMKQANGLSAGGPKGLEPEWSFVVRQLERRQPERVLTGHDGAVQSLAVSPDGNRLAAGDSKGTIRIWNLETGELQATLAAHEGEVRALAFSPAGDRLASGGQFHDLTLWETVTWQPVNSVDAHDGTITTLVWRPDGDQIASGGRDGKIRLSNSLTLEEVKSLDAGNVVNRVRYTPEGTTLITADKGNRVAKWNLRDVAPQAQEIVRSECNPEVVEVAGTGRFALLHDGRFYPLDLSRVQLSTSVVAHTSAVISEAGHWGATATIYGTIELYRWSDDPLLAVSHQRWRGHVPHRVDALAATPDGSRLISSGSDGAVNVWRIVDVAEPQRDWLKTQRAIVRSLAFSPDDRLIATVNDDGWVRVYETRDGHLLDSLKLSEQEDIATFLHFAADSQTVIIHSQKPRQRFTVWEPGSKRPHHDIPTPDVSHISASSAGDRLALTLARKQGILLWDTVTQQALCTIDSEPNEDQISTALSPDGRQLGIVSLAGPFTGVSLYDLVTGVRRRIAETIPNSLPPVFDHHGDRLAVIDFRGAQLQLIDVARAEITESTYLGEAPFRGTGPDFSPDGELIAIALRGSEDMNGSVQLLHLGTKRTLLTLRPHTFGASQVRFSHSGRLLASIIPRPDGDGNAGVFLWRFDPFRRSPAR